MEYLNWELTVLSRAIAYTNLSGAASHIGLSQPQISRIIARLESELDIVLLDRDTKRKSSWTPEAFRLCDIYNRTFQQFRSEVQQLGAEAEPTAIRIGSLEGLIDVASAFSHRLFTKSAALTVELSIADLDDLEEQHFKGSLEFLFTSREPGKKKLSHSKLLGYQSIDEFGSEAGFHVMSSFEYATQIAGHKRRSSEKVLISNSLNVREKWIRNFGGRGTIPSTIQKRSRPRQGEVPVLLLAPDHLPKRLWTLAMESLPQGGALSAGQI